MKKNKNISARSTLLTGCAALLAALCAALLPALTACNDNDFTGNDGDKKNPADAVSLTVSLEGSEGVTRAGTDAPYTPAADDALVLYNDFVGATGNQTATYYYTPGTPEGATGTWGPKDANHPLYWDDMTAITDGATSGKLYSFYAVASHGQTLSTGTDGTGILTTGTVSHDQAALSATDGSTPENYNNADLLMGYTYTTKRKEPLAFTLKHLLAQLTVTLSTGTGNEAFTSEQLAGATATVSSLKTGYILTYTAVTDEATASNAKNKPAVAQADDSSGTTTFSMLRNVNSDHSVTFRLIAPPQTLEQDAKIVLTIDGKSYTMKASGIELKQGTNTVQPIVASKTGLEPGTVTVTPWQVEEKDPQDVGADGIEPGNEDLKGIKENGTMTLFVYKSDGTKLSHQGTYPISYTAGSNATINKTALNYSPIRWDNLDKYQAGSSTKLQEYIYVAYFSPANYSIDNIPTDGEKLNHEKDFLGSVSEANPWGKAPNFTLPDGKTEGSADDRRLRHLEARFTVKLQCNDGTYDASALNAATLTVIRNKKNKLLVTSATEVKISSKDITNAAEKTVTLVKTADAADASADGSTAAQPATFEALICPQTLTNPADGTGYLTLTLGSGASAKTYTLKAPAGGVTLNANQRYTLTANVTKTDVSIGAIDVTHWEDIDGGSGDFEPNI